MGGGDLTVIRAHGGTNFQVSPEQAITLDWLTSSLEVTGSFPPLIASDAKAVDLAEPPARYKCETYRIVRDTGVTRSLKGKYQDRCQVCGLQVLLAGGEHYSEAHHIRPLGGGHKGPDKPNNVTVLCPNHHAQFDLGAMAIDPKTPKIVTAYPDDEYNGRPLLLSHELDRDCLQYAWKEIFGKGRNTAG